MIFGEKSCAHSAMKAAHREGLFTPSFSGARFHLCGFETEFTCYGDGSAELPTYYLRIPGRFTAGENPYGYEDPEELLQALAAQRGEIAR